MEKELATTQPDALLSLAIEKNADIDKLERLLALRQEWEKNEARKAFKIAMAQFQAEKPIITKSAKAHNSKYAPLSKIQQTIDPVLSKFGITYRWEQEEVNDKVKLTCVVSHIDGHEEMTHLTAPLDGSGSKNAIQSMGSTVSYLKRYTLEAALGLSSDDDDDGGKPKSKPLPELTPADTKKWEAAMFAVESGETSISSIKKHYTLSPENEKLLRNGK